MELGKVKAKVAKLAKDKNIDVQNAWDIFFFDEVLLRLSKSKYCNSFIIKGGFYLQSIVGVESRSTMDIDFKYVGNELSSEKLKKIFTEICSNEIEKNIKLTIIAVDDITTETKYGGKTITIEARFFNIKKIFGIDIGIGDVVTPYPIDYKYSLSFKDETCTLLAYTVETIIAEKLETLISKGIKNSRSKDLFDLYLLSKQSYDINSLNIAMINTFNLRGTLYDKKFIKKTLNDVFEFERIRILYENYARKNKFVNGVSFEMCKNATMNIINQLVFKNKIKLSDYDIQLHLVRHGETKDGTVGGWSDSSLSKKGKQEIVDIISQLEEYNLFISSDLKRAKETSEIIMDKLNMEIIYDYNLREINNGIFKNMSSSEFIKNYDNYRYDMLQINQHYIGGESPEEFYARVKNAFLNLLENNKSKKILMVTHAGVITIILCILNGYVYSNKLKISPHTGSLIKLK
jgi:broad specificity phosphatase PhoE